MPGCDFLALSPLGWGCYGRVQFPLPGLTVCPDSLTGMNAAVRAVTRMGIYVGAKVFLIYEVRPREVGVRWGCGGGAAGVRRGCGRGVAYGEVTCVWSCREHTVLGLEIVCCVLVTFEAFRWLGLDVVWGKGIELRHLQNGNILWGLCPLILSHSH